MTRVLVCGSRDYANVEHLRCVLDAFHDTTPISLLIEGEAPGADTLAREWAESRGIEVAKYPAQWGKYYPRARAGPIRNRQMLKEGQPEHVIAFPKGRLSDSQGTKDMVNIAQRAGVPTVIIGVDNIGVNA